MPKGHPKRKIVREAALPYRGVDGRSILPETFESPQYETDGRPNGRD